MYRMPSGATTLGGEGRPIINSDIHNPQCHLREDLCENSPKAPEMVMFLLSKISYLLPRI